METAPAGAAPARDPLGFVSLAESAIALVRAHPLPILLPLVLMGAISSGSGAGPEMRFDGRGPSLSPGEIMFMLPFLAFAVLLGLALLVVLFVLGSLAWLMAAKAALAADEGRPLDLVAAFHAARPQTLRAAWTFFLFFLALVVGLILLVVPGLVVLAGLAPLSAVVAQEGLSGPAALRRTWELTRGHRWPLLGLALVAFLAAGAVGALLAFAPGLGGALGGIAWGTFVAAMAVFYRRRMPGAPPAGAL